MPVYLFSLTRDEKGHTGTMSSAPQTRVEKVERQDFDKRRNTNADHRSAAAGQLRHLVREPLQDGGLEVIFLFPSSFSSNDIDIDFFLVTSSNYTTYTTTITPLVRPLPRTFFSSPISPTQLPQNPSPTMSATETFSAPAEVHTFDGLLSDFDGTIVDSTDGMKISNRDFDPHCDTEANYIFLGQQS